MKTKVKCRICGKEFKRITHTHLKKIHNMSIDEYMETYKLTCEDIISESSRNKLGYRKDDLIKKYGKVAGLKKWKSYCDRQKKTNTFEYKKNKYGWDEKKFKEYNKSRSSTLKNFILRYGIDIGTKKWDSYCKLQAYAGSSLEYYVDNYGEVDGLKRWNAVCAKKAITLKNCIIRYGEKLGNIKWNEFLDKKAKRGYYSGISQEMFNEISLKVGIDRAKDFRYHSHKYEYIINYDNNIAFVDFFDFKTNKIIEFNGDYWHANPKKYNKNDDIRGKLASDIWFADEERMKFIKGKFKNVLIIWENDYKNNKELVIDECIKFLEN